MTRQIARVTAGTEVGAAREALAAATDLAGAYIYVTDTAGRLLGVIPWPRLMTAQAGGDVATLALPRTGVLPGTDREIVAARAIEEHWGEVPVVDAEGRLQGAVLARTLVRVLEEEHHEDLNRLTGVMHTMGQAARALEVPPLARLWVRLPWLLVGLAGSALAAVVMAGYETRLAADLRLAVFVPAIVYLADAIGTQSEAVAVRGLHLTQRSFLALLAGELLTGALLGSVLGGLAGPVVWLVFGDLALAAVVGLTILAAGSLACAIGILLPWLFGRLGQDPALGSGPVATVIQDVLSLLVYFTLAALLMRG